MDKIIMKRVIKNVETITMLGPVGPVSSMQVNDRCVRQWENRKQYKQRKQKTET